MNDARTSNHEITPADDMSSAEPASSLLDHVSHSHVSHSPLPLIARLPDLGSRTTAAVILAQTAVPSPPRIAPPSTSPSGDWRDVAIRYLSVAVLLVGVLATAVQWRYHHASAETARQHTSVPDRPTSTREGQP
ncbi:MAG: hypothetical protein ACKPEY_04835 [Planctomycetota bacterium]